MKQAKKYLFLLVILLMIAGIIVTFISYRQNNKEVNLRAIALNELQNNSDFYLTGVVEPKSIIDYKLDKNKGVISERKVNVGDAVTEGQVLFIYKNPDGDMQVREAELTVGNNEQIVVQKEKEADLRLQQQQNLTIQQQELNKTSTKSKTEEERKELLQKQEDLKASIVQAEIEINTVFTEIENAKLEVEKAILELNKLKEVQGNHEVVSKINGIVMNLDDSQINLTISEKAPDKPFLSVVDTSTYSLKGKVDEYRKTDLEVNQKVKITDRNDSSKIWNGKITQIGNLAAGGIVDEEQGGNPNLSQFSFEVTLDPADEPPQIGLHCFAEIEQENDKKIVTIPKEYVVKEKNHYYIWTVKNKKSKKKNIEIDPKTENANRYILKSDLPDNFPLIYPSSKLSEGMEVE